MAEYMINNFYAKKIEKDSVLLTTDHGDWTILSKDDYDNFIGGKLQDISPIISGLKDKGIIISPENINTVIESYRAHYSYLFSPPVLHIVAVTPHCTQSCLYCSAAAEGENKLEMNMDRKTAKSVVDFILKTPAKKIAIEFQGGETLLNFDIIKFIVEYSRKEAKKLDKNISYTLVTNLRKMDDGILGYLKKNNVGVGSSLDGPKYLHDRQRISRDGVSSYDNVIYWVKRSQEIGYPIGVMPVVTKYSLPFWKEIVDEYVALGMKCITIKHIFPVGSAKDNKSSIAITGDELFGFWKNVLDYLISINRKGYYISEDFTSHVLGRACGHLSYMCTRELCGAAISQLSYDSKGDIFVCDALKTIDSFVLGNVFESKYEDIMLSKKALSFRSLPKNALQCDYCFASPYCGVCHVNTYGDQGNIVPKLPLSSVCRFRKKAIEYIFKKMSTPDREILLTWLKKGSVEIIHKH